MIRIPYKCVEEAKHKLNPFCKGEHFGVCACVVVGFLN